MRASTSSRPISSSVASIDGVCASPVTITRSGIAIFGSFSLCSLDHGLDGLVDLRAVPFDCGQALPQIDKRRLELRRVVLSRELCARLATHIEITPGAGELCDRADALLEQRYDLHERRTGVDIAAGGDKKRLGKLRHAYVVGFLQILLIEPRELFRIEARRRLADVLEIEPFDQLLARELLFVAVRPAEPREVIHERFGQVTLFS